MDHRRTGGSKLIMMVVCMAAMCRAIPIGDLLDRASQRSDKLHSLSTTLSTMLAQDTEAYFPPLGRMKMCHTSSLQTPNDKQQTLEVTESDLMSLARSLLQAWADPLMVLSNSVNTLSHPAQSSISNQLQELQEYSRTLKDGLDILSGRMGPAAQSIFSLPYRGGTDLGHDKITKLVNFNFLLSCLRRDTHKIDSFLKVLRCRAAKRQPELC
ncbi:prolactin [Melanotaenia boesemani]|uniref:prolactin n=1 Tax=Melanotaenia boesemani TaxID=1250792 RepID=UPI001C0497B2|nr:prolactin [Melanotaenia boesemani]